MDTLIWIFAGIVLVTPLVLLFVMPSSIVSCGSRKPKALIDRPEAAAVWSEILVSSRSVDQLLEFLGSDYDLAEAALQRVRPDDTLNGLYSMIYTRRPFCDNMEGVEFAMAVENAAGVELSDDFYELPLLKFAQILEDASSPPGPSS